MSSIWKPVYVALEDELLVWERGFDRQQRPATRDPLIELEIYGAHA
jgi:hypothetical protein